MISECDKPSPTESVLQISSRGLYEAWYRQRKLVFILSALAAIVAGLYDLTQPKVYEATARVLVARTRSRAMGGPNQQTAVDAESFAAFLRSDTTLNRVLSDLPVLQADPFEYGVRQLRQATRIRVVRNENALLVEVKLPDLVADTDILAASTANSFVAVAESIAEELLEKDFSRSMNLLEREFEPTRQRLEEARQKYREAQATSQEQAAEQLILSLGDGLAATLSELAAVEANGKLAAGSLDSLNGLLESELPTLELTRQLADEPVFEALVSSRTPTLDVGAYTALRLVVEQENPVYTKLRELRDQAAAEASGYQEAVEALRTQVADLMAQMAQAQADYNRSIAEVTLWRKEFETVQGTYGEVLRQRQLAGLAIATDRQDLVRWTPAVPTPMPVDISPWAAAALAFLVAFLMLSVLAVGRAILPSIPDDKS